MKKRIAFISEHASPLAIIGGVDSGGQNIYVAKLASNLVKQGFNVDIFTRLDNITTDEIVEYEHGVRVINITAGPKEFIIKEKIHPFMNEFATSMIQFIETNKIQYELIHAHFWMSGYVASILKETLAIPFVITFHALGKIRRVFQGVSDEFPDSRFQIEENVAKYADLIIAECDQDKEDLIIYYNAEPDKIKIIPCGFDKNEFYPVNKYHTRRKLGIDPTKFTLLQLGRIVKRKGIENVIRGLAEVIKYKNIPIQLLIVGGDSVMPDPLATPEIGRLTEIAKELNVFDKITFTGRKNRDQLKDYYNAADIFITTPWYEPFGITPLEAMACGTPVIGANVGGIKYSVAHGETGFLVPPNDPDILAKRIIQLYENNSLMRKFSLHSIQRVNTLFTWDKVSKMMSEVYLQMNKRKTTNKTTFQNSWNEFIMGLRKNKSLKEVI